MEDRQAHVDGRNRQLRHRGHTREVTLVLLVLRVVLADARQPRIQDRAVGVRTVVLHRRLIRAVHLLRRRRFKLVFVHLRHLLLHVVVPLRGNHRVHQHQQPNEDDEDRQADALEERLLRRLPPMLRLHCGSHLSCPLFGAVAYRRPPVSNWGRNFFALLPAGVRAPVGVPGRLPV